MQGSTSLNEVEAAHLEMWRRTQAELNRLTQGTEVKRQIPFLDEFPVQIRKLGVEGETLFRMVHAVSVVRSREAVTALRAEEDFCGIGKGKHVSQRGQEEPDQLIQESKADVGMMALFPCV